MRNLADRPNVYVISFFACCRQLDSACVCKSQDNSLPWYIHDRCGIDASSLSKEAKQQLHEAQFKAKAKRQSVGEQVCESIQKTFDLRASSSIE